MYTNLGCYSRHTTHRYGEEDVLTSLIPHLQYCTAQLLAGHLINQNEKQTSLIRTMGILNIMQFNRKVHGSNDELQASVSGCFKCALDALTIMARSDTSWC